MSGEQLALFDVVQDVSIETSRRVLGGVIAGAFADMGIAEEELARAMTHEESKHVFPLLQRPTALHGKASWMYRAHVVELCERFVAGSQPLDPTDAEMLAALCATSLAAPLNQQGRAAYGKLFASCAKRGRDGRAMALHAEVGPFREPWADAADEMLHAIRTRMRGETNRHRWYQPTKAGLAA